MLLSDRDIKKLIQAGTLIVDPFDNSQISPTSIDLHIGSALGKHIVPLIQLDAIPEPIRFEIDPNKGYTLEPNTFVLSWPLECIHLPMGYTWYIETKGNIARAGLMITNCGGDLTSQGDGIITLGLSNVSNNPIVITRNILVFQLFIGDTQTSKKAMRKRN